MAGRCLFCYRLYLASACETALGKVVKGDRGGHTLVERQGMSYAEAVRLVEAGVHSHAAVLPSLLLGCLL